MARIKFETKAHAAEMMTFAKADGFIDGWTITNSGYVRYLCARSRYWLDLTENTFKAWKYAY